jgi:signal transduction histidine kinase
LTVAEDLPTVEADADRLERFLLELLENAVMHGGGAVRVDPMDGGFAVVDDGPGIAESERERALEAGYTTDPERTGFGLAIVDWTADAHGWNLDLTESEHGGVRVEVTDVTVV